MSAITIAGDCAPSPRVGLTVLFEIGLVLLGVTLVVNALAQLLLKTFAGPNLSAQQ